MGNNSFIQQLSEARQAYNREGGVEPINGTIAVPWRTKKDLSIWLIYLAYVFPMRAEPSQHFTHDQIAELIEKECGLSRSTYFNYLAIMEERGWMIPTKPMTQWEQSCYLNGREWQLQREKECAITAG